MTYARVYLVLLGLLGLTLLAYAAPLPQALSTFLNFSIGGMKAALIAYYFMHLDRANTLVRIFAAGVFLWLLSLLGLTFCDYLTRL